MGILKLLDALFTDPETREANERMERANQRAADAAKKRDEANARLAAVRRQGEQERRVVQKVRELEARAQHEHLLEENSEAFSRQLAAIPRVEIRRASPAFTSAPAPDFSLVRYELLGPKATALKLGIYVVVDVETTGLDPEENEIVQLSAVRFKAFQPVDCFTTYIKPRKGLRKEAVAINGITEDMVKDAPYIEEIINGFREYIGDRLPLVGHNLKFDLGFLCASGCVPLGAKRQYFDTLKLSRILCREDSYKLDRLDKSLLQIDREDAHDSLSDALITGLLLAKLCAVYAVKYDRKSQKEETS